MVESLITNEYRRLMWNKSKDIISKISSVIEVKKVIILGSFTTLKPRPADVDFIMMIQTKDTEDDWSTDVQFVPSSKFGEASINDAKLWMEEKYGKGNYTVFEYDINEINSTND